MKEIKQVNGKVNDKTSHIHGLEYLILIKCSYYPNCLWIQWNPHQNFSDILYRNKENNSKIPIELDPEQPKQSSSRRTKWEVWHSDFKIYYKAK